MRSMLVSSLLLCLDCTCLFIFSSMCKISFLPFKYARQAQDDWDTAILRQTHFLLTETEFIIKKITQ